ncbi:MAG: hypothetical protein K6B75_04655, partial [Lachnospiraceae bacterium]|nr:hypothetical protein [Lachnospiraceae bacterium]
NGSLDYLYNNDNYSMDITDTVTYAKTGVESRESVISDDVLEKMENEAISFRDYLDTIKASYTLFHSSSNNLMSTNGDDYGVKQESFTEIPVWYANRDKTDVRTISLPKSEYTYIEYANDKLIINKFRFYYMDGGYSYSELPWEQRYVIYTFYYYPSIMEDGIRRVDAENIDKEIAEFYFSGEDYVCGKGEYNGFKYVYAYATDRDYTQALTDCYIFVDIGAENLVCMKASATGISSNEEISALIEGAFAYLPN